MFLDDRIHSVL